MAKCPHCEMLVHLKSDETSTSRIRKEIVGTVKKEVMYSCPHCEKVLGFAFFFGGLATGRP